MPFRLLLLLALIATLSGCPRFAGSGGDGGLSDRPVERLDPDGDGLCSDTEATFGSNPDLADSDRDGFPDIAEFMLRSNPARAFSPDRSTIIQLDAESGQEVTTTVNARVDGGNGNVTAVLQNIIVVTSDRMRLPTAMDYLSQVRANSATPPNNIVGIDGAVFQGVRDGTELWAEVTFRSQGNAQTCVEALPFLISFQKADGQAVNTNRILVRRPAGTDIQSSMWCSPVPRGYCL